MSRSLASIACEKIKAEMTLRLVKELNSPGQPSPLRTAYETCPMCSGYIMHFNAYGEVDDGCHFCAHMGRIRIRDDKGRFTTREITNPPGTLPPLPMPMPGNPEAGSTPGTAAPASASPSSGVA